VPPKPVEDLARDRGELIELFRREAIDEHAADLLGVTRRGLLDLLMHIGDSYASRLW
jgi:hypothetical protein